MLYISNKKLLTRFFIFISTLSTLIKMKHLVETWLFDMTLQVKKCL